MHPAKRNSVLLCLLLAPLLQLIGDALWVSQTSPFAWSIWREASYIFFIPVGFLLAKLVAPKSMNWAIAACALYVVGSFGSAAMMPLFRLGAFYPTEGQNEFPAIVQSVLDKNAFAVTLFLPGLCFPVSLVLFGIAFLKHKVLPAALGVAFCVAGLLFWTGNAMEMNLILIIADAWLLVVFCWLGFVVFKIGFNYPIVRLSPGPK